MSDSKPHPSFGPWELASATSSWYLATTTSLLPLATVASNVSNLDDFFSDEDKEVKN